ncbi:MAG: class I SAM-dependent methyltransferase [Acidimicrobiales bacterium]
MEHPLYAAAYDRLLASAEAAGLAERRADLLADATGRVLEVGGGTGHNLKWYSAAGAVVVLEPDGAMCRRLEPRLADCPVPATLIPAGIEEADLQDGSFDTVVCTLVLCTVPDLDKAVARIRRLLAPGGRLLFLEHTAAPGGWGLVQRAADPLWRRAVPGCHLHRDPISAIRRSGLMVAGYDRIDLPLVPGLLRAGVVGTACERTADTPVAPGTYPRSRSLGSHLSRFGSAGQAPGSAGQAPGSAGQAPGSAGQAPGSAGQAPGSAGQALSGAAR